MCSSVKVPSLDFTTPKSTLILSAPLISPIAVATFDPFAWLASEFLSTATSLAFAVVGA